MNWVQSKSESTVELVSFGSAQIGILKVRYIRKKSTFELSVNYPQSTKESKELFWVINNSFKRVRAFQIKLKFRSTDFRGECNWIRASGEKPFGTRREPTTETQPTYMYGVDTKIWTQTTLVAGECSDTHHGATPSSLYVKLWTWRQLKNKMQN